MTSPFQSYLSIGADPKTAQALPLDDWPLEDAMCHLCASDKYDLTRKTGEEIVEMVAEAIREAYGQSETNTEPGDYL